MPNCLTACLCLLLFGASAMAQKKTVSAFRVTESISIDGNLTEAAWAGAEPATDFIMYAPDNGKPISPERRTDVKILYDDNAIYIGAVMFDENPSAILKEMTQRDVNGSAEHFGVFINGFNDGQQDFRFLVSAAGVQLDCVATESFGEDFSWDAIWSSNVKLTDFGWVVEMKIPYAALRFSESEKQTWGLNFYREFRRDRQQYTWNRIDTAIGAELTQTGQLTGIENIKPPVRLFFIPYSSYYYDTSNGRHPHTLKGGMDIKYGINDSFTLDAILIPDFGQTRYDNVELNLGPFEQQFNENRPFFTEGTDLFNKGGLLYSRRIGGSPALFLTDPDPDLEITNPQVVDLLNALKVSGRTKGGLGIGVLNAVTERTYASVRRLSTGESSEVLVEPLANYNVMVFDQRFNQNSSVSFVNTNVTREGNFRDANVSALVWDLNTKKNTYNLNGDFKYSYVNEFADAEDRKGFSTSLYFNETSGKYRYSVGGNYVSRHYDINDLGINFYTNYHSVSGGFSYRILNPTKKLNTFNTSVNLYSEFDNRTGRIQTGSVNYNLSLTDKKNDYYGLGLNARPVENYDFYEPRFPGRFVYIPRNFGGYAYFSSNYNRKFAIDIQPSFTLTDEKTRENWSLYVEPRYRFTDRITGNVSFSFSRQNNNVGYIDDSYVDDATPFDIYFTKRNRTTYSVSTGGKYAINKDMTLNLSARYYWSYAENMEFFTLTDEGYLQPAIYTEDRNSNFNTWNLDFGYSWWFAPGSQITMLYRNNSGTFVREINKDIGTNFRGLFQDNLAHIFSISVRYFFDYNRIRNW